MGIMLISSRDKNPKIKCERKHLKKTKTQKILSSKISTKMHENCKKKKKKKEKKRKVNNDLQALDNKNLEKI